MAVQTDEERASMKRELVIATCQFPVSGQIERNLAFTLKLIAQAHHKGADIVHFSESSLSGYAGVDFPTCDPQQAALLAAALNRVAAHAARLKLWVI